MAKGDSDTHSSIPWTVFDLAEGLFLAHSLSVLERLGILESLQEPLTVGELAAKHHADVGVLDAALQMLAVRTRLIVQRSGKYSVTSKYGEVERFQLLQYVGAYSNNAVALDQILRDPSVAGGLVDREQHARAFELERTWGRDTLADVMLRRGLNHALDLGCGTASMLLYLASQRPEFRGWGIDSNPWACAVAQRRVTAAGQGKRIKLFEGDCRDVKDILPSKVVRVVGTLTATGVANEFFANGNTNAVAWLARLKSLFPGRIMLIADYYGQLGKAKKISSREVALHDFVQVMSGQGVPPANLEEWQMIYRTAQCDLIQVIQSRNSPSFIHVLKF